MFNLDNLNKHINSKTSDFLDYLRVYIIDDESFEILEELASDSDIYIIGGIIRDFFLGRIGFARDLDFVSEKSLKYSYRQFRFYHKYFNNAILNNFSGLKLLGKNGVNIDVWQLNKTWGILNKGIKKPTPNDLIDSVFFNFSAIIFDFVHKKFIYNHNFISFINNKEIDIVYEENPNIPLCLFNLFYYSKTLNLRLSYKAKIWIKNHLSYNINFEDIQTKHLGKILFSTNQIMTELEKECKNISIFNIDWDKYLSSSRFKDSTLKYDQSGTDKRCPFESDFGRVVFSSAMRRMHDKTQVIPLTSGDKIHTRLTHSIEVMNVAESLALNLCRNKDFVNEYGKDNAYHLERAIASILKTAAFVHDIGNPPFGHFGETVIKNYFKRYLDNHILCNKYKLDYEEFDGNAQGFRILTHLSYVGYLSGLNLTYATLAAYLKYPNPGQIDKSYIGTKKHGIFCTERHVFDKVVENCHLMREDGKVKRHPLAFLVEAADSICYNIMDIEDGYLLHWYDKDDIISFLDNQITSFLNNNLEKTKSENLQKFDELQLKYCPFKKEINSSDYSFLKIIYNNPDYKEREEKINRVHWIMKLRVQLISYLVKLASDNFKHNISKIDSGDYNTELIEEDDFFVAKTLQKFTQRYIFPQLDIQKAELTGHSVLNGLLDILLHYISSNDVEFRKRIKNILSKSSLRVAIHEDESKGNDPNEYKVITEDVFFNYDLAKLSDNAKLRIVVDFISGMTDKFAVLLYQQLSGLKV